MDKRIEGTSELMQQMTEKLGKYEEDYSHKVRIGGLGCMTELPCPHQKDINGVCCCMQEEGSCEYQMLSGK